MKFGGVNSSIRNLINATAVKRVWVLLDEWSSVPLELQPYLADLLRRCVCNIPKVTLKIAALEYRSNFKISLGGGQYIGLEVGAELTSNINMDDYLVFENDSSKARDFYTKLFARHVRAHDEFPVALVELSDDRLANLIFTQQNAFDELVMAAEGVPRDAINIASLAAQQSDNKKLSIPSLKRAARQWYLSVKKTAVDDERLTKLLDWIVDRVIGERRARAFLVETGTISPQLDALFDARILHVTKREISLPDPAEPEATPVRYDAFKLDYGCYVHLMATRLPPSFDEEGRQILADVPTDDYRSVRRAVLDLGQFNAETPA